MQNSNAADQLFGEDVFRNMYEIAKFFEELRYQRIMQSRSKAEAKHVF